MKTVLPWSIVVILAAVLVVLYTTNRGKDAQLASAQADRRQLEQLRSENEGLKKIQVQADELARLRKENVEIHRLRNEVHQLREEKQQFSKAGPAPQPAAVPSPGDTAIQQQLQQQIQQLLAENERLRAEGQVQQQQQVQSQAGPCINNLRMIEGAKEQWGLENKQPQGSLPSAQDLEPYFRNNTFPVCPAGGTYTINAIGTPATCNIPGHVLPVQ